MPGLDLAQLEACGALHRDKEGALIVHIHVQPGARTTEAVGLHGDRLKVRLAAPPVDGKANKALIAWAAKAFGVRKADVTLLRGHASRQKTLHIIV